MMFIRSRFLSVSPVTRPIAFFLRTAAGYALLISAVLLVLRLFRFPPRTDIQTADGMVGLISAGMAAPLIETIVFQLPFCELARKLGLRQWLQVSVSAVPFAAVHFLIGIPTGILAGAILGFYLSYIYISYRQVSAAMAFCTTVIFHGTNNMILLALICMLRSWDK